MGGFQKKKSTITGFFSLRPPKICGSHMIFYICRYRFKYALYKIFASSRVGRTWLPCHVMAKHGHDHAMMTAWWPCFLAWSSWCMSWSWYDYHVFHDSYHDHGIIIMFSIFFRENWIVCQCFLKQLLPYTMIWHIWLALKHFRPSKCRVSKIKRKLLQKDL